MPVGASSGEAGCPVTSATKGAAGSHEAKLWAKFSELVTKITGHHHDYHSLDALVDALFSDSLVQLTREATLEAARAKELPIVEE